MSEKHAEMAQSTHGNDVVDGEFVSTDRHSDNPLPPKRGRKGKGRTQMIPQVGGGGGDFLPRARVGKLRTVADWLREHGKVYRAVRRGQMPSEHGARLGYLTTIGKQLAEAHEQIRQRDQLIAELQRRNDLLASHSDAPQLTPIDCATFPAEPIDCQAIEVTQ